MAEQPEFVTARMHESRHFFFCPHCSLSFPHPPWHASFYRIGYGFCWYCVLWTPPVDGDERGIVRVDETGKLYTVLYEIADKQKS
jgi:hypothetical protein